MLEGAGNRGRQELQPAAEAFARRGVTTLVYDKRKVGYSLLRRDYALLADDAAAVALMATRRDVDPSRPRIVGPIGRCLRRAARLPSVECGQVRDHSRRGRGDSSGADRLGLRPVPPPRGVAGGLPHALEITALRTMISAGLFPEANFDPAPAWQRVRQPVLPNGVSLTKSPSPGEQHGHRGSTAPRR